MKYRRKGEIVEAAYYPTHVWHGRGAYVNETWASGWYLVVDEAGVLHIYDRHRFENEFERVPEKDAAIPSWRGGPLAREYTAPDPDLRPAPGYIDLRASAPPFFKKPDYGFCQYYVCAACGKWMGKGEVFVVPAGHREAFCWKCYQKRHSAKERSAPLTIADINPGDVFEYDFSDGVRTCQHMGARTAASVYWRGFFTNAGGDKPYLYDWKWSKESQDMSELRRLGHHNLTEKQRFWVDADSEMREALEKSISEKWLPIMRGEKCGRGVCDCPLCQVSNSCFQCLCHQGRLQGCAESGGYFRGCEEVKEPVSYDGARRFTLWLASFLPNIHPLRIEVGDMPVEWPGKARDK